MAKHKALKDAIREKANRERLMSMMHEQMKKSYQRGLLVGTRTMLKVISDRIAESDKQADELLEEIKKMIGNMLGMTEKTEQEEEKNIEALIKERGDASDELLEGILDKATEVEEPEDAGK